MSRGFSNFIKTNQPKEPPKTDQQILADLTAKLGLEPKKIKYNDRGHLVRLDLSLGLTALPPEIGRLFNRETFT